MDPGKILENMVRRRMFLSYDADVDLGSLDWSILNIPYVLNVAPLIWAKGMKCSIDVLDAQFFTSLRNIKQGFQSLYPFLEWDGEIFPEKLIHNTLPEPRNSIRNILFFSGGVDSTYSALKANLNETALLIVRGHDISLEDNEAWDLVLDKASHFSESLGVKTFTVSANIFRFLYYSPIHKQFPRLIPWYGTVQHALSIAGLAFPIAFYNGWDQVCFSSSNDEISEHLPWGAHPLIEPKLNAGGISVVSTGDNITWVKKIRHIVEYYRERPHLGKPQLRVCLDGMSGKTGNNCSECLKCLRRVVALMLFSEDPNEWGFEIPEPLFSVVKTRCLNLKFNSIYETYYWKDMARTARSYFDKESYEYRAFFIWLEKWNPRVLSDTTREKER